MKNNDIIAQYKHSKIGTFMFNLCAKWTKFLVKHLWLYYILALTWGVVMTALGWIITIILFIAKLFAWKKITFDWYHLVYSISVGPKYWGGCEMGLMFLKDHSKPSIYLDGHELGHTFQNCLLGPLFPFIVAIPSATRWWQRELWPNKNWKPYDSAWFEDSASQCGAYVVQYLEEKKRKLNK